MRITLTPDQIKLIETLRAGGNSWEDTSYMFNAQTGLDMSATALRFQAARNSASKKTVEERYSQAQASYVKKGVNKQLDIAALKQDCLAAVASVISKNKIVVETRTPKEKKSTAGKRSMTVELLLSDLHYGKVTPMFNKDVARSRMKRIASLLNEEIERESAHFKVDNIIIAILGDVIESATMHGLESYTGCEMSNAEQVQLAIESLFQDIILAVSLNNPNTNITVVCTPGNHDRTELNKTYNKIGRSYLSWIVYNSLQLLSEQVKLKNINFNICEESYLVHKIYKDVVLYNHGDFLKNNSYDAALKYQTQVENQISTKINFARFGHWHEYRVYGQGKFIFNGCLPGQDSYALNKGYSTEPTQTINYYVDTVNRPTSFYKSLPIYLG